MGGCSWCRVGLGNPYSTRWVTALPYLRIVLSRPASSPYFGEGIAMTRRITAAVPLQAQFMIAKDRMKI